MHTLEFLQSWYAKQCDGKWEHSYGIKIGTVDNPGWRVDIDLVGTKLDQRVFSAINLERGKNGWMRCWVDKSTFKIACSPNNLEAGLEAFRDWATEEA
jgi:hypothetical protein